MTTQVRQDDRHSVATPARAPELELTILMPCLNEAETVQTCVEKAIGFLRRTGVAGEVVVADNGSTDGSQALAEAAGARVVAHMAEVLPEDAIVCNGAGNFAAWLHRFYKHRAYHTQLAPTSGAMGYGFPAAIAAKLLNPGREVICFAGDGDFLMTGQEMATAVQYGANVVTIVADNGSYGTIRAHQEQRYPGRAMATDLKNPDFAAYARAFGAWSVRVERTEHFPAALEEARSAGVPALIHLVTELEDIAPGRTLSELRARGA